MHILVVEDDAPLAKIVKKSLESGGHTVDVAVDGQEGLDLGRQRSHDAVVLDIQLPKVRSSVVVGSGYHTVRWDPRDTKAMPGSGVYFVRFQAAGQSFVKRFVLLR